MKRLLPLGLVFVLACAREPTSDAMPDDLADASLEAMREMTAVLHGIVDRESWRKSQPKLAALADDMKKLRERSEDRSKMNLPTRKKMEDRYHGKLDEASADLKGELERIARNVDSGKDFVQVIRKQLKDTLEREQEEKEDRDRKKYGRKLFYFF